MKNDAFAACHPGIGFLFFAAAIIFGMCFIHPAFLAASCCLSAAYLISLRRTAALKVITVSFIAFVLIAVINPIFNTNGEHILFTLPGGRAYTLESLMYGMAVGGMFATIIVWFAAYNRVMTSDKFIYLFGRMIPSLSLVLTMILRLIPGFQKKTMQIAGARKSIGKGRHLGKKGEAVREGMTIISALTGWALEGGIVTSDSMQSRGYGSGPRSSFSVYRFDGRSRGLLIILILLIAMILICAIRGGMRTTFIPSVEMTGIDDPFMMAGLIAYILLLAVPTAMNLMEELRWYSLRSRI